jgi:hypothetical protein
MADVFTVLAKDHEFHPGASMTGAHQVGLIEGFLGGARIDLTSSPYPRHN